MNQSFLRYQMYQRSERKVVLFTDHFQSELKVFIFSTTVSLGSKFDHATEAIDTSPLTKTGHEKNRESFMLRQTYLRDRYFKRYLFNLLRVMIICIVTPLERDKFRNNDFIGPRKL